MTLSKGDEDFLRFLTKKKY